MNRRNAVAGLAALLSGGVGVVATAALAQEGGETKELAAKLLASPSPLGERSLGRAEAPVVMVMYGSTTCEHSAEFNEKVWPQLRRDYVDTGKMQFIFREFPLDNLALGTFILVRSLPEEKYFAALDMLWRQQKLWRTRNPKEEMLRIMQVAGMDRAMFDRSIQRKDIGQAIYESGQKAKLEFGIKKTPTIYINGRLIAGHEDYEEFRPVIERELRA